MNDETRKLQAEMAESRRAFYEAAEADTTWPHGVKEFTHAPDCVGGHSPNVSCTEAAIPRGILPTGHKERKDTPIARGVLDYFPLALAEVARVSKQGNDQHNPGQPMHWAKEKSTDHADCIVRHLIERGTLDTDGMRHSAKAAWRALALLQTELEESK